MFYISVDNCSGIVDVDFDKFSDFEYGYVVMIYKLQGMMVYGNVLVLYFWMFDWYLMDVLFSC